MFFLVCFFFVFFFLFKTVLYIKKNIYRACAIIYHRLQLALHTIELLVVSIMAFGIKNLGNTCWLRSAVLGSHSVIL